ncbi:hypothetical protein EsH8_IX_000243 [Colletotrichum jinshuiense]
MASEGAPMNTSPQEPARDTAITTGANPSAEAARVIERTNSWKPSYGRRQSWNKEDQKRELQMSHIEDVKTGPGFTERG